MSDSSTYHLVEGKRGKIFFFDLTATRLKQVHAATCVLHASGFSLAFFMIQTDRDWTVPIVSSHADWRQIDESRGGCCCDEVTGEANCYVTPVFSRQPGRISLATLVAIYHLLSFSWQFLVLTVDKVYTFYLSELSKRRNCLRWLEYSLSSPLMTVTIAIMFGVVDISLLAALGMCTSALQWFGYAQEIFSHDDVKLTKNPIVRHAPMAGGFVFFFSFWSLITFAFTESILKRGKGEVPPTDMTVAIYLVFCSMTALFLCFAFVLAYDVAARNRPTTYSYLWIEMLYCILSVTSKWVLGALLVWMVSIRKKQIQLEFRVTPQCEVL